MENIYNTFKSDRPNLHSTEEAGVPKVNPIVFCNRHLIVLHRDGKMPDTRGQVKNAKPATAVADQEMEALGEWQKFSEKILGSINKRFDLLDGKIETLMSIQQILSERLDAADEQFSDHEQRIDELESRVADMKKTNDKLLIKIDELEGRSRCNNIKIVGIPEGEERGRPTEYITDLLPKLLGASNFGKPVTVDQAHRICCPNQKRVRDHGASSPGFTSTRRKN